MNTLYLVLLFLIGLINFLPILGMLSLERLNRSYKLNVTDPNLAILLRHRALLFGLIGGFVFYSIAYPQYQMVALILAGISMLGYLYLLRSIGGANPALKTIGRIDILGLILFSLAIAIRCCLIER